MSTDPETNDPRPSCATGSCGGRSWMVWLGLLAVIVLYTVLDHRSNQTTPAAFTWVEDFDAGLAEARRTNRPVLLKFYATWCAPCRILDREVFSRQDVAEALAGWVPISIDVDKQEPIADRYEISSIPVMLALSPTGEVLARVNGTLSAEEFIRFVRDHQPAVPAGK